jgi:hypothetical protein
MDSDHEQEDPFGPFEEDYQVPVEEMEINVKDGKPKAINIRERDEEIHICDLCGRILITGGRISDFQTEKVAGLDIKNRKEHFLGQPASDDAKMGYCYLCKKDLPSMGAHSDREWKGIQPPPQSLRRSCSLNLSDYVVKNDQANFYPCKKDSPSMGAHSDREWNGIQPPPQSLRRSCSLNLSDYVVKNDQANFYPCKKDLPSMGAHSDREWKGIQPPPQSLRSSSLNLSDYVVKNDQANFYPCKKDLPSMRAHSDREWKGIQPPPQSLRRSCSLNLSDYVVKNDEKKAESEKGYKCSICDISFPTLQGLGGHRSVHGRPEQTRSWLDHR